MPNTSPAPWDDEIGELPQLPGDRVDEFLSNPDTGVRRERPIRLQRCAPEPSDWVKKIAEVIDDPSRA